MPRAILIAGPTASGKSALAVRLAVARGGIVINADSMQVYSDLAVLTARPSAQELAEAPHRLYGHIDGADDYSTGRWLTDVAAVLEETTALGALPIIVGGTGLYFRALTEGLAHVPPIPAEVRAHVRGAFPEPHTPEQNSQLHKELAAIDAVMAQRLRPSDPHRMLRALEVKIATGRSLGEWQADPTAPLLAAADCERIVVDLATEVLRQRCDARFDAMLTTGALDEVKALTARAIDTARPVMRALGVGEIAAYQAGALSRDEAATRAKQATWAYVRRQRTWARRFMADWARADAK